MKSTSPKEVVMTTDPAPAPAESATTEVTAPPGRSIAAPPKLAQPGRSRRRGMLALMIVTIVIGALGAGFFVNRSAVKIEVVGFAHDVAWGQVIAPTDLKMVDVLPDQGLSAVAWTDRTQLSGHKAATALLAGTIASDRSVTSQDVLASGQALVGLLLKPGQLPATPLHPRDHVTLIRTNPISGSASTGSVQGATGTAEVFAVGPVDASGARTIDVIIAAGQVASAANDAADGHIALALLPGS